MSEIERLTRQLEECRSEISFLQNGLSKTRQQLAAAEALNAEAAAAGPIVDARITELEGDVAFWKREASEAASRAGGLRVRLASALASRAVISAELDATEQPAETELERRAWELFVSAMASDGGYVTPEESLSTAAQWIYCRDKQRKAGTT